ncbi:MAG: DUF448 domain-containing protein [Deltaproteobacteria bacterium]|nr:DUF448 domain-containing protein [Deltaproteobacteria bacterium]
MPEPLRTCLACRESAPREDLLRLVASPGGQLTVDLKGRLPGRGVWVHDSLACVQELERRKGAISRGLKQPLLPSEPLRVLILDALHRQVLDGISLSAAAGRLVVGQERLAKALDRGEVAAIALAKDAAPRTVEGLREHAPPHVIFVTLEVGKDELGARLGRGLFAAVGVIRTDATRSLLRQLRRIGNLG